MVRGSPRHSESNGGVERVNRTVQAKLGTWMRDSGSTHWSVGCRLIMWRYNTQQHRTLGDIPYRLMFGQLPRVGISALHLDQTLINTLATEAELNNLVEVINPQDTNIGVVDNRSDEEAEAETLLLEQEDAAQEEAAQDEEQTDELVVDSPMGEVARDLFAAASTSGTQTNNTQSDSDSNDNLTLNQLGQHAPQINNNFTTTGDEEFTAWQVLRSEFSDTAVVDCDYLQKMKLKDKVPIAFCMNESNIMRKESFIPAILVRVSKKQWELMNENDDHVMEQMEWDGDHGIANMVGMYIKHADKEFCDYFQSLTNAFACNATAEESIELTPRRSARNHAGIEKDEITPRRGELRKRAHDKLSKAASSMKKRAAKEAGNDKLCEVGEVVHVPLKDMDKTKVDTGTLTGVIVQVDKSRSQARVAVRTGLLKSWYVYHRLGRITGNGNDVQLNGLGDTLTNWTALPLITEREAARNESMVGGQGKGCVTCNCKGPCNTNQCSCKKAGRTCSSACHRNNFKCVNHDRVKD